MSQDNANYSTDYFKPRGVRGPPGRSTGRHGKNLTIDEFHHKVMATFKTIRCNSTVQHDRKLCQYWHNALDRRRNPFEFEYSPIECSMQTATERCPNGVSCGKCHNTLEKMYHPEVFKLTLCMKEERQEGSCDRGSYCAFAHGVDDLRHIEGQRQGSDNNAHSSRGAQSSHTVEDLRHSVKSTDSPLDKLVALIQSAGPDGLLGSELPKRFQTAFGEAIEVVTENGRLKIKDVLSSHDKVLVVMHKGAQPKYVYHEDAAAIKKVEAEATAAAEAVAEINRPPSTYEDIQRRLVEIVKSYGEEGVLGSDLPKKYLEQFGDKIDVADETGNKLRLKDILAPHPDIKISMYKQLQPRFYYEKGCNIDYVPPPKKEREERKDKGSPGLDTAQPLTVDTSITVSAASEQIDKRAETAQQPQLMVPVPQASNATMQLRHALLVGAAPGLTPPPDKLSPHPHHQSHQQPQHPPQQQVQQSQVPAAHHPADLTFTLPAAQHQPQSHQSQPQYQYSASMASGYQQPSNGMEQSNYFAELLQKVREERVIELKQIAMQLETVERAFLHPVSEHAANNALILLSSLKLLVKSRADELAADSSSLTQQLSVPVPLPPVPPKPMCALKGCNLEGIYICTGCRDAYYCGAIHQK